MLADTLFVAGFASLSQTGLYGVARKIAMPVSLGIGVFQQSWGPMRHDLTQAAVDKLDEEGEYTARLLTYYAVFVSALVLTVSVLADQLVLLAGAGFGDAAALVPITTVAVAGHGWFIFAYRTARANPKIRWLILLSTCRRRSSSPRAAVMLIPVLGASGAPAAAIVAWGIATVAMLAIGQRERRLPLEYGKLARFGGADADGLGRLPPAAARDGAWGWSGELAVLLAWVGLLFATGLVPFAEVRALAGYARHATSNDSKRQPARADRRARRRRRRAGRPAGAPQGASRAGRRAHRPLRRRGDVPHRPRPAPRCNGDGGEPTESDAELGRLSSSAAPTPSASTASRRWSTRAPTRSTPT